MKVAKIYMVPDTPNSGFTTVEVRWEDGVARTAYDDGNPMEILTKIINTREKESPGGKRMSWVIALGIELVVITLGLIVTFIWMVVKG